MITASCVDSLERKLDTCDVFFNMCTHSHPQCIRCKSYISFHSPEVSLLHKLGTFMGALAFSWLYRVRVFTSRLLYGTSFYYSHPSSGCGLKEMVCMAEKGEVEAKIDSVFAMKEVASAYRQVEEKVAGTVILNII